MTETKSTIYLTGLLSKYGYYSRSSVDTDKTETMDINGSISENVKLQSGFRWPNEGTKYTGMSTPDLCTLCLTQFIIKYSK